jgi:hypothetical protein
MYKNVIKTLAFFIMLEALILSACNLATAPAVVNPHILDVVVTNKVEETP